VRKERHTRWELVLATFVATFVGFGGGYHLGLNRYLKTYKGSEQVNLKQMFAECTNDPNTEFLTSCADVKDEVRRHGVKVNEP
jgi:hypothetical protein